MVFRRIFADFHENFSLGGRGAAMGSVRFLLHAPAEAFLLNGIQSLIESVFFHQRSVGALLHKFAVFQHKDLVGVCHGAEAVGDHHDGFSFHKFCKGFLHEHFVFRIEGRGGFVQQNDRRIFEQGAGDGNALALAARQGAAVFAENGFVALRQRAYKFVAVRCFCRCDHGVIARLRIAQANVVHDGVVKKRHVLKHEGQMAHQAFRLYAADVLATHADRSLLHVPESGDELSDRALARAGRSDERRHAALGDGAGKIFDDGFLIVREGHMRQGDVAVQHGFLLSVHCWGGKQRAQPFGDDVEIEERGKIGEDRQDWAVDACDHEQKHQEWQKVDLSPRKQHGADEDREPDARLQDHAGAGHEDADGHLHFHGDFLHRQQRLVESAETRAAHATGFDDLHPFQIFLHLTRGREFGVDLPGEQFSLVFAAEPDDEKRQWHCDKYAQRQPPVEKCQQHASQRDGDAVCDKRRDRARKQGFHAAAIGHHVGGQFREIFGVEKAHREFSEMLGDSQPGPI